MRRFVCILCSVPLLLILLLLVFGCIHTQLQQQRRSATLGQEVTLKNELSGSREGNGRWKRQESVPSDNIQVYAANSNVSVADQVQVLSDESRIHIAETFFNGTFWSNSSLIRFELKEMETGRNNGLITISASDEIALNVGMNGMELSGTGDTLQFNSSTGRGGGNESINSHDTSFMLQLTGKSVNFSLEDNQLFSRLRAVNGRLVFVNGQSWANASVKPNLSVVSALTNNASAAGSAEPQRRELSIVARSQRYEVQVRLEGNELLVFFAGISVNVSADHRTVILRTRDGHRRIVLQTASSPFEVLVEDDMLRINCFDENTVMEVPTLAGKAPLILTAGQLTRVIANRSSSATDGTTKLSVNAAGGSSIRVNGGSSVMVDNLELIAKQLRLYLDNDPAKSNASMIFVDSNHSQLRLQHSSTDTFPTTKAPLMITATFTAARHLLEIVGGEPRIVLQIGNVTFTAESALHDTEASMGWTTNNSVLPPKLMETRGTEDYLRIGPFAPEVVHEGHVIVNRTPVWVSTDEWSKMVEQQGQYIRTTLPTIKEFAPHMIDVDKLFSFHQSLPPTTTMAATPPQASDGGLSYPTPAEKLFTFPQTEKLVEEKVEIKPVHWSEGTRTTESNDTDFLVAHFDTTATTSVPSLSTKTEIQSTTPVSSLNESTTSTATNEETFAHPYAYLVSTTESPPAGGDVNSTLIPISATIVTIEMPENSSASTDEFKGIDRENRPKQQDQNQTTGSTESTVSGAESTTEPSTTKSRELREVVEKRQEKGDQLIELDVKMDTGRDNVELKESPFVRLRVGLERSINHLLNGILGKSGDEDVLVREPRNRRQSEKTNLIVDDHETNSSSVSEPIHIHIRQLQKISPDEGSEEVYRVRFIAEENGKKRSDLSRLIVDALSALGMEELSKNLGTDRLQVLSYPRLYYGLTTSEEENGQQGINWSMVSRIAGGVLLFVAVLGLVWTFATAENRWKLWSLVKRRSSNVTGQTGMVAINQ